MSKSKGHVLIVDDSPVNLDLLTDILTHDGFEVSAAKDGQGALELLGRVSPDVILLDVRMPRLDGFETCHLLKRLPQARDIPVIFMTALAETADKVKGFEAGAVDYITKPIQVAEMLARVETHLTWRRLQVQLQEQNARLQEQVAALAWASDELRATLRLREDLSNTVVHDLRNFLNCVLGFGMLLKRSLSAPRDLELLDELLDSARRVEGLVNDLSVMANAQAEKPVPGRSAADMGQTALMAGKNRKAAARFKQIDLVVDLPEESRRVSLAPSLCQRVLENLLSNGIEFSSKESVITLRVEYPTVSESQEPGARIVVPE